MAVDAFGNAIRFILSGGESPDHWQAENLIADFEFDYLIADKGYDSQSFVESVRRTGARAIIPPRSWNLNQRTVD